MASKQIACTHNAFNQMPDVIFHLGIHCGKSFWKWDGKLMPRGTPLNGIGCYSSDKTRIFAELQPWQETGELRPFGGGVFG